MSEKTLEERFDAKYIPEPNSGCWLWESGFDGWGYGRLKYRRKYLAAHRLSWTIHRGEIPTGMWVLHKCDTPVCVNPDHLFLGTHRDNMRDMVQKGRSYWRFGETHPQAKLTKEDVAAILSDTRPKLIIASDYGIGASHVSAIQLRKKWHHLRD
jgi:hypothetical protein